MIKGSRIIYPQGASQILSFISAVNIIPNLIAFNHKICQECRPDPVSSDFCLLSSINRFEVDSVLPVSHQNRPQPPLYGIAFEQCPVPLIKFFNKAGRV